MNQNQWLRTALWLSIITIVYNIAEGLISIYFGSSDDTLVLLGFGVDSFVEVISRHSDSIHIDHYNVFSFEIQIKNRESTEL